MDKLGVLFVSPWPTLTWISSLVLVYAFAVPVPQVLQDAGIKGGSQLGVLEGSAIVRPKLLVAQLAVKGIIPERVRFGADL